MTNPFEDENGTFHVLINDEGQYSLWPSFVDVPDGWTVGTRPSKRQHRAKSMEAASEQKDDPSE